MEIPHREIATTDAAELILSDLEKLLRDTSPTKKKIDDGLIPVLGVKWNAQVIRGVTANRLREILWSIRNSKLGKIYYRRISSLWEDAQTSEPNIPQTWGEWRRLIENSNIDEVVPLSEWVTVISDLVKLGWDSPIKLAQVTFTLINAGIADGPNNLLPLQIWKSATLLWAESTAQSIIWVRGESADAEKLISRLKGASLRKRAVTNDGKLAINRKSSQKEFTKLGHVGRWQSYAKPLSRSSSSIVFSHSCARTRPYRNSEMFRKLRLIYQMILSILRTPKLPTISRR